MAQYLADTNILIAYVRQRELFREIERRYRLLTPSPEPLLSIVSAAEIRSFAEHRGWSEPTRQRLADTLTAFATIPIVAGPLVDAYVEIDAYSRRVGHEMGKNDLWIAATASATGAILLSTDRDFDHLNGIHLIREWIDPTSSV